MVARAARVGNNPGSFSDRVAGLFSGIRKKGISETAQEVTKTVAQSEVVRGVKKIGPGVLDIIASVVFGTGGVLATYIFKENTAADWAGKGGIVASIIFLIRGVMRLYRKEKVEKETIRDVFVSLDDDESTRCKAYLESLTNLDKSYPSTDKSKVYLYDMGNSTNVRRAAKDLLDANVGAISSRSQVVQSTQLAEGQDIKFSNFGSEAKRLNDIRYENASLLSYIVSSRTNDNFDSDALCSALKTDILRDGTLPGDALLYLPKRFKIVYDVARLYERSHRTHDGSIQKLFEFSPESGFSNADEVVSALTGRVTEKEDPAKEYLGKIQANYNCLKVLERALSFVERNKESNDQNERKEALLIKAALICAFRFKGDNAAIELEFKKLLRGQDTGSLKLEGLKDKLTTMEKEYEEKINTGVISKCSEVVRKVPLPIEDELVKGCEELDFT